MSRRRDAGFSLLEVQVGLLLLTLVVVGFTRLVGAQEGLVRDLEAWCSGDPVFTVVKPDDEHERVARLPAALEERAEERREPFEDSVFDTDAPGAAPEQTSWGNELTIEDVTRDLEPQRARAVMLAVPIRGAGDDDDDSDDDDSDDDEDDEDDDDDDDDDDDSGDSWWERWLEYWRNRRRWR